jgi:hypothetical protein
LKCAHQLVIIGNPFFIDRVGFPACKKGRLEFDDHPSALGHKASGLTEGFDTRPRDGKSVRVTAVLLQKLDILFPQVVRVHGIITVLLVFQRLVPYTWTTAAFVMSA